MVGGWQASAALFSVLVAGWSLAFAQAAPPGNRGDASPGNKGVAQANQTNQPLQRKLEAGADGKALQAAAAEQLAKGLVTVNRVVMQQWDGTETEGDSKPMASTSDVRQAAVMQRYSWGQLFVHWKIFPTRIDLDVEVVNSSDIVLKGISIALADLTLPVFAKGLAPQGQVVSGVDMPDMLICDGEGGALAYGNEEVGRPLYLGLLPSSTSPHAYALTVASFREDRFPRGWLSAPKIDRPLYPQQSDHFRLSLRFGPSPKTPTQLVGDLLLKYLLTYPSTLVWKDRRPIGALHLATSEYRLPKNPRGWFNGDKTVDITTEAGRADFKERLMKYADQSVAILKEMNAQGMILWDVEGEQYPHATTYIGDPRSLPEEIDPLIDTFMKKFTEAGLRVGLCIRPSHPVRKLYGDDAWQMQSDDPAYLLQQKITYAKQRWGCTLFYIDSNVRYDPHFKPNDGAGYELIPAGVVQKLAADNPDCLLIPEQKDTRYYAYTAPYGELRLGVTGTPSMIRALYHDSFSVLYVPDGDIAKNHDALVDAVRHGDILMYRSWFPDPVNAQVKSLYQEAEKAVAK